MLENSKKKFLSYMRGLKLARGNLFPEGEKRKWYSSDKKRYSMAAGPNNNKRAQSGKEEKGNGNRQKKGKVLVKRGKQIVRRGHCEEGGGTSLK